MGVLKFGIFFLGAISAFVSIKTYGLELYLGCYLVISLVVAICARHALGLGDSRTTNMRDA